MKKVYHDYKSEEQKIVYKGSKMRFFIGIKYDKSGNNRTFVEQLMSELVKKGHSIEALPTNNSEGPATEESTALLMQNSFSKIDESDALIIEFSRKGVGLGIEAGYAYAIGKPVYIIASDDSTIPKTLRSISTEIIFYKNVEELLSHQIFSEPE